MARTQQITNEPRILVVGETLMDILHRRDGTTEEKPGGSCANVALALGRLDRRPLLLTNLGDDKHGRTASEWLEKSAVTVRAQRSARTSTASAHLDDTGAARYEFAIEWELNNVEREPIDALHIGSIAATLCPGADAVSALVDRCSRTALISYDPNIRPSLVDAPEETRRRVLSLVSRADVVKASDEDIAWLHPGEDVEDVARSWVESGPELVVITAGAAGAFAATARSMIRVRAVPVEVVDTVGAGDTFMGTLIDGLIALGAFGIQARDRVAALSQPQVLSLLQACARSAAITVSRPGANPPTREEIAHAPRP